jgi:hypothetical protein
VNEGIPVKCGPEVLVSTPQAVRGPELGMLKATVEKTFKVLTDQEKRARSALANLKQISSGAFSNWRNMAEQNSPDDRPPAGAEFPSQVKQKEIRKLTARGHRREGVWFGLGMIGIIGWSVALPAVAGALLGA